MTPLYETSPEADEDIADIIAYTLERWGMKQMRTYTTGLEQHMNDMALGKARLKRFSELGGDVNVSRYEHHYIFAANNKQRPMLVLVFFMSAWTW